MSDTPLTDAIIRSRNTEDSHPFVHLAALSRRLERDRAELLKYADHATDCAKIDYGNRAMECTCDLDALLAKIQAQETTK